MRIILRNFCLSTSGVTAIEYALITALVALAIYGGALTMGNSMGQMFTSIGNMLQNATP